MQMAEEIRGFDGQVNKFMPWVVCFAASLFFFYEFIQGNMFASIADNIMRDFHIKATKMTYLSSVYYLANVIFLFVAGILLDKFSTKKIILAGMLSCVISTFILAYAHSFALAMVCRFVMGIGSAFCFLGPVRLASRWFPPQRMAFVTGIIVTFAMLGGMVAQYPLTKLVLHYGWRQSVVIIGWLGLGMFVMMIRWVKDKEEPEMRQINISAMAKAAYLNSQTLFAACYASLMNIGAAIFGAMMGSLYLMQRLNINKEEAAVVNSMLFLGAIFGGPLIGWWSDRMGRRVLPMKLIALACFATALMILLFPVSYQGMIVLFFLLGFFCAGQVLSYPLVAENSNPVMTATALSMISILLQGGYIIYQNLYSALLGWHGDVRIIEGVPHYSLGDFQSATIILPIGVLIGVVMTFLLKETYCRQKQM